MITKDPDQEIYLLAGIIVLLLAMTVLFSGCVSVDIPDSEWCGDMGVGGATCYHTLSPAQRDIPKAAWDVEREGMICTQSATFASWKGIIEKLCHETKDCNYQQVKAFLEKASSLKRRP